MLREVPTPAGSTGASHSQLSGCCSRELVTLLLFLAPPDWPWVPLLYGADTLWDMDSWEQASSCTFLDCQHLEGDRTQRGSSMRDSSWEGTETPGGEQQKCLEEAGKSFCSVPGSICLGVPWTTSDFWTWDAQTHCILQQDFLLQMPVEGAGAGGMGGRM